MATNGNDSFEESAVVSRKTTPSAANQPETSPLPFNWVTSLPTGTITFLFTDIEGSTPLWERTPQQMAEALQIHNASLRSAIETHGGVVIKTVGDAFQAAFPTASLALRAAIEGQRLLNSTSWNELGPLKVRMGLHTGEAELDPGDDEYAVSHTKNRAERVMSAGHGGQILLSQECADLCSRNLPEDVILQDLGQHRLKGLSILERLFQVIAPGLPADFPALQTLDLFPNNLPLQLTSFIGREKEIAEALRLLAHSRLLTLSGVGGAGKSRLALHLAGEALQEFEHGAWLVELAHLTDPAFILPTVAAVFGFFEDKPEMPLESRLFYHLQSKHLLLIFDNCEHLILEAARFVDKIIRAAPHVKILVTSREALGLTGEVIYLVPSLSMPDLDNLPTPAEMAGYEAIRLFKDRASAVLPDFTLTQANAAQVAQICHRLDGIPLAIELAAARIKVLSTEQICQRLDQRFRLLTGGSRSVLPRQRTLRATIDWSYGLLSTMEQTLLRSLSVFMGGFTLEAAEVVCACEGTDVLDGLAMLVNKSLVEAEIMGGEVYRYRLLETVRQYAQEKLDEAGEYVQARNHHLEYFLEVSKQVEKCMKSLSGLKFVQSLRVEIANFRAAMNWAYGLDEPIMVVQGLQLSSNLFYYWIVLNLFSEGLKWIKKGLALVDENTENFIAVRAKAYGCASGLTNLLDNDHESYLLAKQAVDLFRRCQDGDLVYLVSALSYYAWGIPYLKPERPDDVNAAESHAIRQEITALTDRLGLPWVILHTADFNGLDAMGNQDFKELVIQAEKIRTISLGTDFEGFENWFLGVAATWQGNLPKAIDHYQKMIDFSRTIDYKIMLSVSLRDMGDCAIKLQKDDQAWSCYYESMTLAREIGKKGLFTSALRRLVEISLSRGQYQQAAEHLREGLALAQDMDPDIIAIECLFPLLRAADGIAPPEKMACFLGFIDKHVPYLSTWKKGKAEYDQIATSLQACLDPAIFRASLEIGRQMSREQLQAEALAVVRQVAEAGKPYAS